MFALTQLHLDEHAPADENVNEDVVGSLVHAGTTDDASCSRRCLLHVTHVHVMILADVG
jgi:hypothetical protein